MILFSFPAKFPRGQSVNEHFVALTLQRMIEFILRKGKNMENLILAWISNYIHYEVWDEITWEFLKFNDATIEVWKWISKFILHFTGYVIINSC